MSIFTNAKLIGVNYSPEKYHAENAERGAADYQIGRSSLMEFRTCPHRWKAGFEFAGSPATEWGGALDCLLLTPEQFGQRYAVCPATYSDKKTGEEKPWTFAAAVCKEWRAEHEGKETIKAGVFDEITRAIKSANADSEIAGLLDCSDRQVFILADYEDDATGITVKVKTLIDLVPKLSSAFAKSLGDLKSARDANPSKWPRVVFDMGYDVQAAMSLDLYMAAFPEEDRLDFRHIIVENVAPFEIGRRIVGEEFLTRGRFIYQSALAKYCQCVKSGVWPGYDDEESQQSYRGWTFTSPDEWMVKPNNL